MKKPWEETWVYDEELEQIVVYDEELKQIVSVGSGDYYGPIVETDSGCYIRQKGDMHLLAAAPELYRALAEARSFVDVLRQARLHLAQRDVDGAAEATEDAERAIGTIDAALAKARGDERKPSETEEK